MCHARLMQPAGFHYQRIANAIRYLDEHQADQPDLATLARISGLSSFHFHRLFSNWAGVTPKDFLQCLTAERVKRALQNGSSVLHAALDAGLSGPGRAHDLCVSLAAASPGELKSGGAGWTLNGGFAPTPFGICLIAESPRGVCHLRFVELGEETLAWAQLQAEWPHAVIRRNDTRANEYAAHVFAPKPGIHATPQPLSVYVRGTPFQTRVWQALLAIPAGQLTTYSRLAQQVGHPKAARAVGSAVGANAVAFLIPCHRVIRETGVIGDYRWGRDRKRVLVAAELARA